MSNGYGDGQPDTVSRTFKTLFYLSLLALLLLFLVSIGDLVKLVVVSVLIAYIVDPLAVFFESHGMTRTTATAVIFLSFFLLAGTFALRGDPPFPAQGTKQVPIQSAVPGDSNEVTLRSVYANQSGNAYVVLYDPPALCYAIADRRFFDFVNRRFPGGSWWYDPKKGILAQRGSSGRINAVIASMRVEHQTMPDNIRIEIDAMRALTPLSLRADPKRCYLDSHSIDPGT